MKDKGIALVTVLVFVLLLVIIAGTLLGLMTNQARIAEHQRRRIQGYYASWTGLVHKMERLRLENNTTPENINVGGYSVSITFNTTSGRINSTANYSYSP